MKFKSLFNFFKFSTSKCRTFWFLELFKVSIKSANNKLIKKKVYKIENIRKPLLNTYSGFFHYKGNYDENKKWPSKYTY